MNPQIRTLIVNAGMYIGSLRTNLGFAYQAEILQRIAGWKVNSVVLQRLEDKWKLSRTILTKKLKQKEVARARNTANLVCNKTSSVKRKQQEELEYTDSKTAAKNLGKSILKETNKKIN